MSSSTLAIFTALADLFGCAGGGDDTDHLFLLLEQHAANKGVEPHQLEPSDCSVSDFLDFIESAKASNSEGEAT